MTEHRHLVSGNDQPSASTIDLVVFGSDRRARVLAESVVGSVASVTLVHSDADPDRSADEVDVLDGAVTNAAEVRAIGEAVGPIDAVVAVGPDSEALLAGYLARLELDPDVVIATVNDPGREPAFANTGVERLNVADVLADRIRMRLERACA